MATYKLTSVYETRCIQAKAQYLYTTYSGNLRITPLNKTKYKQKKSYRRQTFSYRWPISCYLRTNVDDLVRVILF